jgi:hypothetical protein
LTTASAARKALLLVGRGKFNSRPDRAGCHLRVVWVQFDSDAPSPRLRSGAARLVPLPAKESSTRSSPSSRQARTVGLSTRVQRNIKYRKTLRLLGHRQ